MPDLSPADYPSRRKLIGSRTIHAARMTTTTDGRAGRQITACGRMNTGAAITSDQVITCPRCCKLLGGVS